VHELYQASFVLRPLVFLGGTKKLREAVKHIVKASPGFADVVVTLFACVFVFTCVGMVLFVRTPEGNTDFANWSHALSRMWILFTTSNSPNVYIPAYNDNRAYFLYFWIYMLVTMYLLTNVLLAKVYESYKEVLKEDIQSHNHNQGVCIERAFTLLAKGRRHITKDTWSEFFVEYCDPAIGGIQVEDPKDGKYNTWRAHIVIQVFHGVNIDAGISLEQFSQIMEVFLDRHTYIAKRRPPKSAINTQSSFGATMETFYVKGFEIGGVKFYWDRVMDCVIGFGSIFTLYQAVWFCKYRNGKMLESPIYWITFAFSVFYILSITTKISCIGFERFWIRRPIQHRFDFINVYGLMIVELLYMFVWPNEDMERAVIILSLARILRLAVYVTPLKHLFFVFKRLIPTYWQMSMLLLNVYFIFIAVGRMLFGGLIYNTNPLLVGQGGFAEYNYWGLNFNDFVGGFVTLATLQVVNNWYVIARGYVLATGTLWASLFFIVFFVLVNLIVLNILMALILDCTSILTEEIMHEEDRHGEDMALDDLEQMASGAGAHSAEYMLRKVLCTDEHFDHHFHQVHGDSDSDFETQGHKRPLHKRKPTFRRAHSMEDSLAYGTFTDSPAVVHRGSGSSPDLLGAATEPVGQVVHSVTLPSSQSRRSVVEGLDLDTTWQPPKKRTDPQSG